MPTLTEVGNQARRVEKDILNSKVYSTDTQISYQAASVSKPLVNTLSFQQEENHKEDDSRASTAGNFYLKEK